MCYIYELSKKYGGIVRLPLTKTGFVRNYCRKHCLYEDNKNIIANLTEICNR